MIYKSSRSLHFHLIIFLTICFTTSVKSDLHGNYEQEDIIRELKQLTKKCGIFYGCKFSLLDSNLPEHKDYYSKLKSNDFISVPLWEKLYYRLNPDNLIYFHSFKERINILRQYAPLKKVISDYCLLYTRDFNTLKTPLDKGRYQRYYEEDTTECNQNYENYCISIDELEKRIDEDFLRYYNLGYSSYTYNISKEIYDHGLVHYCKGNIVESLKLAGDLIELVNKEGPNLKKHLSDARNFFFPDATFIEAMKYSKVIDFLSKSIEKNPSNDATFFHKAAAYLESNNNELFDKAKADVRGDFKSFFATVADPVDVVTGAFYIDEMDLLLPGPFPIKLRRNYNSQNPVPGLLGFGWKLSLNPYLIEDGDHLFAAEEDGTMIDYRYNPSHKRWEVFPEDNPELSNHNKKGIGGKANPYHNYIENNLGYIIVHGSDGSKRQFENKFLRKWSDCAENSHFFIFDQDKLVKIENLQGDFLGFSYNSEGNISEIYSSDGRSVSYKYDFDGNLVGVQFPNNALITYEYDLNHQIIKEIKPHGVFLGNIYDELGRVIEQHSPNDGQQKDLTTVKFIYEDGITTVIDAAGGHTEYKIYQKNIYKITDPLGNQILQSHFIDTNTWFDADTEQVKPWFEKGSYPRSLKSSKDKRGHMAEYLYDEKGNPIQMTFKGNDLTGNGDKQITKIMMFDEHNCCIMEQTLDNKTITTYDTVHSYLPTRMEKYVREKLIGWIDLQYNAKGQVIYEDKSGAITHWEYDDYGFPKKKISKTGTEDLEDIVSFKYNNLGQLIEEVFHDAIIRHDYDVMGNLTTTSIYDLSGCLISSKCYSYNKNNALIQQVGLDPYDIIQMDYNSAGLLKEKRQHLTKAVLDEDKKIQIKDAGIAYTLYDYDALGRLIEEVDSNGHYTYREYDLLGRVSKISKMNSETQFSYEAGGLISKITFPNGEKSSKEYATNGLLIKETYPDKTESCYKYDLFGRIVSVTKNGITIEIEYDDALQKNLI